MNWGLTGTSEQGMDREHGIDREQRTGYGQGTVNWAWAENSELGVDREQ